MIKATFKELLTKHVVELTEDEEKHYKFYNVANNYVLLVLDGESDWMEIDLIACAINEGYLEFWSNGELAHECDADDKINCRLLRELQGEHLI